MKIPPRISRRLLGALALLGLATSLAAAPTITSQPMGGAIASGNNATFSVAATGTGALSYQWRKDGAPLANGTFILGATTPTLTLTNPQVADAGAYSVVVTDAADAQTVTSDPAALAVANEPPRILSQTAGALQVMQPGNARLFVNLAGSTPFTMQWRRNGVALNGPFTGSSVSLVDLLGVTPERAGTYQLEVSNAFGQVVADPIAVTLRGYEPTEIWSFAHPGPQGNQLNALAFGPGRAYAVGNGGTVLTSTDGGASWADASASFPRTQASLNSALYDPTNNQFILGGGFTQLFTAPANGDPFTDRAPAAPANESYNGLARDPASGRLVAVGGDFTTRPTRALARVSTDGGATWAPSLPGPTNGALNAVAFGAQRFVAVGPGGSGNNLLHSPDGLAWSPAALTPAAGQTFRRVVFANGQFVAVGDGGVLYTSPDGENFTQRVSGTTQSLRGVALLSGAGATAEWAAVGLGRTVLTSTDDAVTWAPSPATGGVLEGFPNLALLDVQTDGTHAFVLAPAGRLLRSATLAGFTTASLADVGFSVQTNYTAAFNDVLWDAPTGRYLAVADQGNIHASPDGFAWSRAADLPGAFDFMPGIARFNSQLLVTGFKRVATSPDGVTWTEQPEIAGAGGSLWALAASATRAVAVGNGGTIATSADGVGWATAASGTASDFRAVAHGNNRFVAVGGNDSGGTSIVIRTSDDDGQTWTARDPGTTGQLWGVDYGDGVWIAAGSRNVVDGDTFILRSFDQGATWTRSDLPGTGFTFRLRHLNGVWYAIGFPGTLAVSRDRGETWDYVPLPARPGIATLRGIAVKDTYPANAVIVGNDSTILVSGGESPNAPEFIRQPTATFAPTGGEVEFTAAALNTLGATYQWRKGGNPIAGATTPRLRLANVQPGDAASAYDVVVTNPNGASATSAPAALVVGPALAANLPDFAWRNPLPEGGTLLPVIHAFGKFIAAGVGGRVLTSPDGATWSPAADLAFEQANGLATDGTTAVLVGGSSRIFSSTDAVTWTPRGTQQQFNFRWFNAVAFAAGQFVAVGDQGLIATSADSGATWTVRASGTTQRLTSVAGTTGRFVAAGDGGALLTSTDGVTWAPGTAPGSHATAPFQGAAFLNGQFILAAGNAAPLTSADGLAWTARPTGFGDWIHRLGFTGTHYVATLSGGSAVLRSADLTTWERVPFASAQPGAATFFGVATGGGATVIVGAGGEIRSSTDHGATWTSRGAEGGVQILNEVRALPDGGGFVAVGSHGTVLASDDGRVWRRLNTHSGHWLSSVATGLGRVIVTTQFGDILDTVNGDFFDDRTVGDNLANWGSVFTNGKFVVVADQGRVRVSTDGLNWTTTQIPGVTTNLRSVAARGDLVVIVADGGRIFSSTDFTTWTERTSGTGWNLNRVRAIDDVFLAVGDNRTALLSTDGVAWTALPVPDDFSQFGFSFRDIAKLSDGYYVASSEGRVVKTADLRTWTRVAQVAHQTRLLSLATDGTELVLAGEGGALLSAAHPAVAAAPAFVTGLPAQTLFAGNSDVQLGVFATGAGPLAYQWSKDGAPLAGATGPLLTLPGTTSAGAGAYTVTVTNALGQAATSTTQLAVAGLPTGAGPLFGVGDLPGGIVVSQIRDATKVGSVIHAVGSSAANPGSASSDTAIAWSSTDGLTVLPSLLPGATGTTFVTASALTPDGAFIAARARPGSFGLRHAVRVDRVALTNLSFGNLGGFAGVSAATAISDDGAVLYGFGINGAGQTQAVRFTAAGPTAQAIPFLNAGDTVSFPAGGRGTSSDGTVMVGESSSDTTRHAFRYVHGTGVSAIPELAGGTWSSALAVSADGNLTLVAGDSPAAPKGELYLHDATTGARTPLGTPNAAWSPANLAGMTGDGAVAIAFFSSDAGESISYFRNAHGWFPLATALATLPGADLTGWDLDGALGISSDGTLVFGSGLHQGNTEGFVAEFPAGFLAAFNLPESILTPPASQSVTSGAAATFSVTVADPAQATFQWRKDGVPVAGATAATLTLPAVTRADAGRYDVVVTAGGNTVTSAGAVLSVAPTAFPGQLAYDPTFHPEPLSNSTRIYTALPLPDGGWMVGGDFVRWEGAPRAFLARLHADLSLDATFTPPLINGFVYALARDTAGRLYVGGEFTQVDGHGFPGLFRLDAAGALDLTWFNDGATPNATVSALATQADGKLLVARQATLPGQAVTAGPDVLQRLDSDGTLDPSFTVNLTVNGQRLYAIVAQPDGAVAFAGRFTAVNGTARFGLARVSATGELDPGFGGATGVGTDLAVFDLARLADGKYLAAGAFTQMAGTARSKVALLNADGTLDPSFDPVALAGNAHAAARLADGRIIVGGAITAAGGAATHGFVRLTAAGAVDQLFTAGATVTTPTTTTIGRSLHLFPRADGTTAVFGTFQSILDARRTSVAVLTAAGGLAPSPAPALLRPAFTGSAHAVAGGRTAVFGSIDVAGAAATAAHHALRVNDDGSLDPTFPAGTGFTLNGLSTFGLFRAVRQGDGKFVGVGDLAAVNGNAVSRIARLDAAGAFDASFNGGAGPSSFFPAITAISGGRTLLYNGGTGFTYNGSAAARMFRIAADGSLDTSLALRAASPGTAGFSFVHEQPDGRMIVLGGVTTYDGNPVNGLFRLLPDGAFDPSFTPGSGPSGGTITSVTGLADGRLVIAGSFTGYNGQSANRVAVLSRDGVLDGSFQAPAALDALVGQVLPQEDGKLIVAGDFTGTPVRGVARLNANGSLDATFGLHGITGGFNSNSRLVMGDDGSIYVHNTPVSFNGGVPVALARFRGAPVAPTLAVAPVGATATIGSPFVLAVRAAGTGPFTYQWRKDGVDVPAATNSFLSGQSLELADAGSYTVVVTGPGGTVTSEPAVLTVTGLAPVMQDEPVSRRVVAGGNVQFRASASGTAPLTYQWRKDGADLPGATGADLWLGPVAPADAGAYTVRVANSGGAVVSAAANLTVLPADPVLWQQFTEWSGQQAPARLFSDGAGNLYASWAAQDRAPDVAGGRLVGAVARFNETTGVLDPTFQLDRRIRNAGPVVRLGNGQLLVATRAGDASTVLRVSATGVVDAAFTAPRFARAIRFLALQPDGKVLVAATDNLNANAPAGALAAAAPGLHRLNANGTVDAGFTPAAFNAAGLLFAPPVVDAAGRIYLAGAFSTVNGAARTNLARLAADGTLDAAFATTLPAGFFSNQARGVGLQADGRAVFVGDFRSTARGTSGDPIMAIRFNADGTFDGTFAQPLRSALGLNPAVGIRLRHLVMQPDDKVVAVSDRLVRLNVDGSPDATFASHAFANEAFWVARSGDGRYFVPDVRGVFGANLEQPLWANGIAAFAADGTPDPSFQTGGYGSADYPTSARVLADGTVLVAGRFNRFGTTPLPGLARFTAPGTLAATQVAPPAGAAANFLSLPNAAVAAAANDRTFVSWTSDPDSLGGFGPGLRRLHADGTIDATFNAVLPAGYNLGTALPIAAPAGRLLLAQGFVDASVALAGGTGDALLRLNADGSRDTGFNPALASFAAVDRAAGTNAVTLIRTGGLNVAQVLPDGRVLLTVSAIDGNLRLLRLQANGALDATFNAPSFGAIAPSAGFTTTITDPVTNVTAQFPLQTFSAFELVRAAVQLPDGRVYVGGRLALPGAPRGLVRLQADGTLDPTFTGAGLATTATDAGPYVDALAVDSSGRLYVAGRFTSFNAVAVPGLFRLAPDGTLDTAWAPGFGLRDVPVAGASLIIANDRLHVFGTPGVAGEALPLPYRFVDIPPSNLPLLLTQPASVAVADGDLTTLAVSVFGPGPFTFQWARNGVPVAGATAATLTLDPVTAANAGTYTVAVTGPLGGTVTSAGAVVSVTPSAPGFDPAGNLFGDFGDVVAAGTNAALHAVPSFGSTPITGYQWRFNGADLPGATDPSLFLANWQPADAGLYSVRATNAQGATTSPAEPIYVQPEGGWRWRNPLPTGNGLTFVRFLNGQFFAGGTRGTLLTSADGLAWTQRTVPTTNNLLGLQLLNGRFVLLGSLNAAYTSADGLAWTPRELPLNGALTQLQDLMAGGGQVVAVGTGGLTARSADGLAWTVGTLAPGVTETVFGGGFILNRFYAVGTETGRVYSSADGATWTTTPTPATAGLLGLAQGAGRFVAVGVGGAIVTSTDALTWTPVASPATLDLNHVAFANNRFVATGDLGTLFTSADGLTWAARSSGGNQSTLLESAFGNGLHVVIGQAGNTGRTLLTSPDATTWTSRLSGPRQGGGLLGLATNGTTLVAVGRDFTGNALALSTADGVAWTDRAAGTNQPRRAVAYAAGQFVAVGDGSVVTTSADGATWSLVSATGLAGATLRGVTHDGTQWLAVGEGGGLFTSADAVAWTARAVPTTAAVNQVAFAGGTYAAVTGAGEILTSADAANWTTRVGAGGPALNAITQGAGTFVAVGDGGVAYTSTDGTGWTPRRFTTTSLVSVHYLHGSFLATSASHRTYVSTDGVTWTGRTTGSFDGLRATAEFAGQLVGVGDFGTILTAGAPVVVGPASLMVNNGAPAVLRAAVSASPFPVTYVWSKDGAPLAGAPAAPILTLPAAGPGDVGAYTLAATNAFGTTTSAPANLTLNVGVALTAQPQPQTVLVGGTATFSVTATGDPAPTYRWRLNGLDLPGATTATLTLTNVQLSSAGTVTVVVSNPGGSVTSTGVALTVHPLAPVITSAATALAVVNQPFSYRITTNQTTVAAFTATGLPAGLSFNGATGVISGTPTVTGATTVTLGAANVSGSATLGLALTVAPPPPVITSPASAAGRVGVPFAYTITATNAPTGFLASGLPAGLALDGAAGLISGTPTAAGAFAVALAAQNATGANSILLALAVAPPLNAPAYSGPTQLGATAGAGFTFTPNFGAGATGFALVNLPGGAASVLPAGLSLDPVTGVISGTPTEVGGRSVALQATNAAGTATVVLTLTVNPAPSAPLFTSPSSAVGTVGTAFTFALTTSPAATTFGSTALPAGLALDPATGVISGTPTAPGITTVGVTATNANGTALATLNLTVNSSALAPVLTSFPVALGRVGTPLTFALTATNAPEQFLVVTGTLPAGLTLDGATGVISGTPTASGQTRVWFAARTAAGGRGPALEMLFDVAAPLNVPVITSNGTAAGQVGQPFTYQITATNAPTGFAATALPPGLSLNTGTGALTGVPQAETATPFFVALTATNADGTSLPKLVALSVAPAPATPRLTSPASAGGRVGVAFSYQATASENPTSFASGPLPAGLVLDPVNGLLSGTPQVAGSFVVPLRAGNAAGLGQAQNVAFTFAAALEAPRITSASSATGRVGTAFTYQIVATGTPTSYAVTGDLPLGLALNTLTGVISGNPADDPDLYEVALTATNAAGTSQPQTLLLAIFPADNVPVITSPTSATGRVGEAFTYQITATNVPGTTPFPASTFLDAVGLPAGLAVNPSTGLIQGTPSATGTFTVLLVGVNENGFGLPRVLTVTINPAPSAPVVTSPAAAAAQVGQPFSYQITATNLPTAFEALDAPAWLSVDNATGLLVGVPVAPGPLGLRLRAANAGGESALAPLTVAIAAAAGTPVITSGQAALGQVGAGFSFQLAATNTPTTFAATGLPAGLVLNAATGALTGTPQVSGTFAVTVSATNATGPGQPVTLTLTINASVQIVGG